MGQVSDESWIQDEDSMADAAGVAFELALVPGGEPLTRHEKVTLTTGHVERMDSVAKVAQRMGRG